MIEQYLLNKNENFTVSKSKNVCELIQPSVPALQKSIARCGKNPRIAHTLSCSCDVSFIRSIPIVRASVQTQRQAAA